jgi:hypothetical protein
VPTAAVPATRTADVAPRLLTTHDALQLQRTIGNRAVGRLVGPVLQRQPELIKDETYRDPRHPSLLLTKLPESRYRIVSTGVVVRYDSEQDKYFRIDGDQAEFELASASEVKGDVGATEFGGIGERGVGVTSVEAPTTLTTTGMISCVGWLLYNDQAAYLTHIVVLKPQHVKADGTIAAQVSAVSALFETVTGSKPKHVVIRVDKEQPAYAAKADTAWQSAWMRELVPAGVKASWDPLGGDLGHIVLPSPGGRKVWEGPPIKVSYADTVQTTGPALKEESASSGAAFYAPFELSEDEWTVAKQRLQRIAGDRASSSSSPPKPNTAAAHRARAGQLAESEFSKRLFMGLSALDGRIKQLDEKEPLRAEWAELMGEYGKPRPKG